MHFSYSLASMVLFPLDLFLKVMHLFHCRGSLYKLLHRSGAREVLDERRRLNMAFDVVLPSHILSVLFLSTPRL